ncbi:hypothetical protein SLOPH_1691 [Spraguea lophii 42_110]|uniref:Uncharacterized protein n=1 Tax=Spraguea lophii (strain 42_110) TaxID=1358809 RepID=S7XU31_SPRLO|nr:hypothetical protein SLOPH_1691 [Spraguea lophii 42_110]
MVVILEREGAKRCALEAMNIEPFTQKPFVDMINESHSRRIDYYLVRIKCANKGTLKASNTYYCYDGRQMCKYIFEMVISPEGRKIAIKNFVDPIFKETITEMAFFRLRYDSETPLRAEYAGNHLDFLESNSFRSKIFFKEDPLDSLSVNFQFKKIKNIPKLNKKQLLSIFLTILMILVISTFVIVTLEKKRDNKIDVRAGDINYKVKIK